MVSLAGNVTRFQGTDVFFLDNSPGYMVIYGLLTRSNRLVVQSKEDGTMYAVITTGGKQYKVSPGDVVRVESLEAKKGDIIELKDVFMVADGDKVSVGKPILASAKVTAEVIGEGRGEKLLIFKHRRRKGFRKTNGHRQNYTAIKVKDITA
jgi:large subunit ribosomal protein L21